MNFTVIPDEQTPNTPEITDVKQFIEDHKEQIEGFTQYAISRTDGIGLAANQCALDGQRFNLRMICVKDAHTHDPIIAIDPKITKTFGFPRYLVEGCLTWQGKAILAKRYPLIEVEFYDTEGIKQKIVAAAFQGQVWQHEINHINGVEEDVRQTAKEAFFLSQEYADSSGISNLTRNDKCGCGSGKKYKKCCLQYDELWKR